MVKSTNRGFTLVEMLVVLLILGILAAVATPLYLQHTKRARMSEAIATMGLIRQAERDFNVNNNAFFDVKEDATVAVGAGNIQKGLPQSVVAATGVPTPDPSGIDITTDTTQYFSNASFFVDADTAPGNITATQAGLFATPGPVDFIVSVKGNNSFKCTGNIDKTAKQSCAIHADQVAGYEAMMDNSGRIFVCYATCSTASNWSAY